MTYQKVRRQSSSSASKSDSQHEKSQFGTRPFTVPSLQQFQETPEIQTNSQTEEEPPFSAFSRMSIHPPEGPRDHQKPLID
ncbi:MAG TPA: hypothetical protein VK203_18565 [Nostocaceae cyanobacterium]|nr:hypothetical protein [Nostocaceae cyanobacterium]